MATQKEKAIQIPTSKKVQALAAKLASAGITPAQRTILRFAPAVVQMPSITIYGPEDVQNLCNAAENAGTDLMVYARAFIGMEPSAQGVSPQQLYSVSPFFWSSAPEEAAAIVCIPCPDGKYRASGMLSALSRHLAGFPDHLNQVMGKMVEGVQVIKPITKAPSLPKAIFNTSGQNPAAVMALLEGFQEAEQLPAIVQKAGKAAAAPDLDPFSDLDAWL